jgi:predicted permease
MPDKLKNARLCLLINGWLSAVGAFLFALMFFIISVGLASTDDPDAAAGAFFVAILGLIVVLLFAAAAVISFMAAKGITEKKEWAKVVAVIIAVLTVGNFPIGTALGVFILLGIFDESSKSWFSSSQATTQPTVTDDKKQTPPTK